MRKFGYFLYSETEDTFLQEVQFLDEVRCCPILYDCYTHVNDSYPSLNIIFKESKPGDVLILRSLEHIALSMKQLSLIIKRLHKHKIHLLVLDQESLHTKRYGMDNVYSFILDFCKVQFELQSKSVLKRDSSFLGKKRYRGWTREKINIAEKCFQMSNKELSVSEISQILLLREGSVRSYIKLCKTDEIKNIIAHVAKKEGVIKRPHGRPLGLSTQNKIKAIELKKLISKRVSPKVIQDKLGLTKASFYRYKGLDKNDLLI